MQLSVLLRIWLAIIVGIESENCAAPSADGLWDQFDTPVVSSDGVWTDWIIDGDWRIQRHAIVGYYRLLDPHERRLAFGSMEQCFGELQRLREAGQLPPMPAQVVICVHGFRGSRASMQEMSQALLEQGSFTVLNFGYASTQGSVQQHALALESVLRNLRGVREVSLVGYSLGNIVVRHLLYKLQQQGKPPPIAFRRLVMISPPNHGAELAGRASERPLIHLLLGEVLDQLAPTRGWPQLETQLATPVFEFGIIAGGIGNDLGYLLRLPGDDDGVLSIRTHWLEGADGYIQTGGLHQRMLQYQSVQAATLRFLQQGQF